VPPIEVPDVVSAGYALVFAIGVGYASTTPRARRLWIEFAAPPPVLCNLVKSGDGSDDLGGVGADRGDRFSGMAASQGRPGCRPFHFRDPSLPTALIQAPPAL
jgi:hypothetical protein